MLTLLILLLLAIGFYTGMKRGLVLQIVYTVGYFFVYLIARTFYQSLAAKLTLYVPYPSPTAETKLVLFNQNITLDLDQAFYGAVAFLLILFFGWLVVRFFSYFCTWTNFCTYNKTSKWARRRFTKPARDVRGNFSSVNDAVNDSDRFSSKSI